MPVININLDDVQDGGFVVPSGKYVAKVKSIEGKTSQAGNPMLEWTWEIVQGDHKGKELRSWTNLAVRGEDVREQKGLFRLKNHLAAFGIDGVVKGLKTETLVGKLAELTVGIRSFKSRESGEDMETNDVKSVAPAKKAAAPKQEHGGEAEGGEDENAEGDLPY